MYFWYSERPIHILKTGIRLQGVQDADNIWKTCRTLHNWLLEVDGLDGEWEGSISLHDARDVLLQIPFALEHLQEGWVPRTYDASSMGPGDVRQRVEVVNEDAEAAVDC